MIDARAIYLAVARVLQHVNEALADALMDFMDDLWLTQMRNLGLWESWLKAVELVL